MREFMFNSASLPVASKKVANAKAKENFSALFEYGNGEVVSLKFETPLEEIFLATNYSMLDFFEYLQKKDIEIAQTLIELLDTKQIVDCDVVKNYKFKIENDTRFDNCNDIKYAFLNDFILFSIGDDTFWEKEKFKCSISCGSKCKNYELYNLFSSETDYLPTFCPLFDLKNKTFFSRTNKQAKGATIYKEIQTGRYWYKDTFHIGASEHYEVFDSTGRDHLGEAGINGMLDTSRADRTKRINDLL